MANNPDNLRQKRDIAQAIFMKFTRLYEQDKFALFCFFEGEDVKYYGIRIKTIARPESYHSLDCKGKVSVLKVFEISKDSFRHFYPEVVKYSWWSARFNSRAKNVGWRIDYFMVSENFLPHVKDAFIMNEIMGSDHCPVGIIIE